MSSEKNCATIRALHFQLEHTPLLGVYQPLGETGTVGSPVDLPSDASSLTITGLTPYTNYSVVVYASTIGGSGNRSSLIQQTEEDG